MLNVILKILGIAGIILLVLLGTLLALLILVLFVPVFYKIQAYAKHKENDSKEDTQEDSAKIPLQLWVKANWLFGLLRVRFVYQDSARFTVKILFFPIMDSARAQKKKEKAEAKEKAQNPKEPEEKPQKNTKQSTKQSTPSSVSEAASDRNAQQRQEPEKASQTDSQEDNATAENAEKEKENKFEKIKCTIRQICDKIKNIRENVTYYRELILCDDTRGLLNHGFMRLGKILKSIRPRKIKADILFGTGSPDTTGYLLGVYGMICPYLGKHVNITPDFERAVLLGEVYAAGHITICKLLWHGLRLFFDKRLRQLIAKLKKKDQAA